METSKPGVGAGTRRTQVTEVMVASVLVFIILLAAYILVLQLFQAMVIVAGTAAWIALVVLALAGPAGC